MRTFTARSLPDRRRVVLAATFVAFLTLWCTLTPVFGASATTSSITGVVWDDLDRDGIPDPNEPRWEGKGVSIYDASGWVDTGVTDSTGRYEVAGLPEGEYRVHYHKTSWREVQYTHVPTTTPGVWPEAYLMVSGGQATFNLGWRPITTSSDWNAPITTHVASSGLRIESFTDAVSAGQVHDALTSGTLLGAEQEFTTVQFGYPDANSSCKHSYSGTTGSYSNFSASCHVDFEDWLQSRHSDLFHEYGHAWSRYHQRIVNQWDDFDPYLVARGIDPDDSRLHSSHAWQPSEMIAEDFRLIFGSESARAWPQENKDIPHATEVEGLSTWLSTTFMGGSESDGDSTPTSDTEAPVLSDLVPTSGSTVSGSMVASVSVSDDVSGVDGLDVSIALDGVEAVAAYDSTSGLWQATLDTMAVADGSATLVATATDAAGNSATASHTVTVDNTTSATTSESTGPEISSIETASINNGETWSARVHVTVVDGGVAASDVGVDATWAGSGKHGTTGTVSCTTGADGRCTLEMSQPKRVSDVTVDISVPAEVMVTVQKP